MHSGTTTSGGVRDPRADFDEDDATAILIKTGRIPFSTSLCPKDQIAADGKMICEICGVNDSHWTSLCLYRFARPYYEAFAKPVLHPYHQVDTTAAMIKYYKKMTLEDYGPEAIPLLQKNLVPLRCHTCGKKDHIILDCPYDPLAEMFQPSLYKCELCGQPGHGYTMCRLKNEWPPSSPCPPGFTVRCGMCLAPGIRCHCPRVLAIVSRDVDMPDIRPLPAYPGQNHIYSFGEWL